jgi:hypothetical protein
MADPNAAKIDAELGCTDNAHPGTTRENPSTNSVSHGRTGRSAGRMITSISSCL